MNYRPATPPGQTAVPNVPLFKYHGQYYYRPHYATVLGMLAGVQRQLETFNDFMRNVPAGPGVERNMPVPPLTAHVDVMQFVHRAPRSWWRGLDSCSGHIMMLWAGSDAKHNLLMEWLLGRCGVVPPGSTG